MFEMRAEYGPAELSYIRNDKTEHKQKVTLRYSNDYTTHTEKTKLELTLYQDRPK